MSPRSVLLPFAAACVAVTGLLLLLDDESHLPWEPTRRLDPSVIPVAEEFLTRVYRDLDCDRAATLLDEPSAFIERAQCRAVTDGKAGKLIEWRWTPPVLKRDCRETPSVLGPKWGYGFDELGPVDCVRVQLSSLSCERRKSTSRYNLMVFFARSRDGGWKVSHAASAGDFSATFYSGSCSLAERQRLARLRKLRAS